MSESRTGRAATVRCGFCLALNEVDLERWAERPKCGECDRPVLLDRPVKVEEEDFERTVLGADARCWSTSTPSGAARAG